MPNNPPPYTEVFDSKLTNHWTSRFSTGAGRATRPIIVRGRGRGAATRGRTVNFTDCGAKHCHRAHCEACQPPPVQVEVNIATSHPVADSEPLRQSRTLNPLATSFAAGSRAQLGARRSESRRISISRRSVSTTRADSPENRRQPSALPSTPAAGNPDNSRPSLPLLQPEIQFLQTIDCRLRFQVADQFSYHRISTNFRRLEYTCSCSRPKNKCTCDTAELTVNLGLHVILRNQEPRCQTPDSED
jgi:hypothetical protein